MAEAAPATEGNEARRRAMLQAAAELISERGFGETRIADVAKRAGTSSGLVIYYFGTRDRLLVDALRFSEEAFYDAASTLLDEEQRLPQAAVDARRSGRACRSCAGEVSGAWGLWLDLWATALRHPEVREARVELDGRWRDLIERVVRDGQRGRASSATSTAPVRAHVQRRCSTGSPPRWRSTTRRSPPTWPTTSRWSTPSSGSAAPPPRQARRRRSAGGARSAAPPVTRGHAASWARPPRRRSAAGRAAAQHLHRRGENQHATRSPGTAVNERGPAWLATWTSSTWASPTSTRTWVAAPR